ncbi:MAG: glycosyltransferase [Muribaculaceae bacterium]|nr:glycosyltransferase [Muribaculaceae bacterium]
MDSSSPVTATVILLTYRQKDTVARAMESLLRQECPYRYEILVADDGSPDATREICAQYAAIYPDIIRMMPESPNKGLVDNYFDAVEAAEGRYVADCAGDDEWLDPMRLQRQIDALEADASLSAVCCDVEVLNTADGSSEVTAGKVYEGSGTPEFADGATVLKGALDSESGLPFILSSALFRREPLMALLRTHPEVVRCHDGGVEDIPVISALGASGGVLRLPFVGYRYYIDGESLSNSRSDERQYRFTARVSDMVRRLGDFYGMEPKDQITFFNAKFSYMAGLARRANDPALAADLKRRLPLWRLPLPLKARLNLLLLKLKSRFFN